MSNRPVGRAPDYTNAALIMLGVNLTWVLIAIWAIWGFIAAMSLGAVLNHGISRIASRRS